MKRRDWLTEDVRDNGSFIPKIIHTIWPHESWCDLFEVCVQQMRKLHPDFEVKVWRLDNLFDYYNKPQIDAMIEGGYYFKVAGFLGMDAISRFGGVYLDIDSYLLRPIDPLLYGAKRVLMRRNTRYYGCNFMASVSHDSYFANCIRYVPDCMGHQINHPLPNDLLTPARIFYWIEDNKEHIKYTAKPLAHHYTHMPETHSVKSFVYDFLDRGGYRYSRNRAGCANTNEKFEPTGLPAHTRGFRVIPDTNKYQVHMYSEGVLTTLAEGERNFAMLMRDLRYSGEEI